MESERFDILCIGDPHFKVDNKAQTDALTECVHNILKEHALPDMIVILGDVLDTHAKISMEAQSRAVRFIKSLEVGDVAVIVLVGNHDLPHNECMPPHTDYSLIGLGESVINSPVLIDKKGFNFVMTPYTPAGKLVGSLDRHVREWKTVDMVFAHQELRGAKYGRKKDLGSTTGDQWLPEYPFIVSGHIHERDDTLGPNILYTGTPFQHRFGDSEDKSLTWLTLYKSKPTDIEVVPLTSGKYLECGILDLPAICPKRVVSLQRSEVDTFVLEPTVHYGFKIHGTLIECHALDKNPRIREWRRLGHLIRYKMVETKRPSTTPANDVPFVDLLRDAAPPGMDELVKKVLTL